MENAMSILYRGDTFGGQCALKISDPANPQYQQPFPIPTNSTVRMYWPGAPSSVILSTENPGEITYIVQSDGTFSYKGSPAKSLLMIKGIGLAVDVVVTTPTGDQYTFEAAKILTIKDRSNP